MRQPKQVVFLRGGRTSSFEECTSAGALDDPRADLAIGPIQPGGRITIPEIARRLAIGRLAVYAMLEKGIIPGIRLGRRWIVTRHAYELWERTCGLSGPGACGSRSQPN